MSDLNPDDIERLSRAINNLAVAIDPLTNKVDEATGEMDDYDKKIKKLKEDTAKYSQVAAGFYKNIASSSGSFESLNPIIDLTTKAIDSVASKFGDFGKLIGTLGQVAGEALKLANAQLQIGWDAYRGLSKSGLVSSFEDLRSASDTTRLKYEDLAKVLGESSVDLASAFGSGSKGVKAFEKLSDQLYDTREEFRRLGYDQNDFAEAMLKFQNQQIKLGRTSQLQTDNVGNATQTYIERLDLLSRITGANIKDQQNIRDNALNEGRFLASIANMGEDAQDAIQDFNVALTKQAGPQVAAGFRDMLSGVYTENSKSFYLTYGKEGKEIVDKFRRGEIKSIDEVTKQLNALKDAGGKYLENTRRQTQNAGPDKVNTRLYVETNRFAKSARTSAEEVAELTEAVKKTRKGQNANSDALANAQGKIYDAGRNFQSVATSSDVVIKAVDLFAEGLYEASDILFKVAGKDLPEEVKQRRKEMALRKQQTKLEKELYDIQVKNKEQLEKEAELQKAINDLDSKDEATKKRAQDYIKTHGGSVEAAKKQVSRAGTALENANKEELRQRGRELGKKKATESAYAADFGDDLNKYIKSAESTSGGKTNPKIIEAAKQIAAKYGAQGLQFTGFNDLYHHAEREKSAHTRGDAFDFVLNKVGNEKGLELVKSLQIPGVNFDYEGPGTPGSTGVHIHGQVSGKRFGGGIASGRQYLVGESGPEIITSGTNGSVTPNEVFNGAFAMLGSKLDKVASLLEEGNGTRKKVLQKARA